MREMLQPNTIPPPPGGCREAGSSPRFMAPSTASRQHSLGRLLACSMAAHLAKSLCNGKCNRVA